MRGVAEMTLAGTRGLMTAATPPQTLPYAGPFTQSELLLVEDAIVIAWARISARMLLAGRREPEITKALVEELDSLLTDAAGVVPGYDSDVFQTPVRGNEMTNFDGSHIEKRPDIVFRRAGISAIAKTNHALFVECKRVHNDATLTSYCTHGIARFVRGDYAWAVSVAMMLGYASSPFTLPKDLEIHFAAGLASCHHALTHPGLSTIGRCTASHHDRTFTYPSGAPPGQIVLRHMWLPLATTRPSRRRPRRKVVADIRPARRKRT